MSKTFSLRVPNAADYAGSPLLDDDDDEEAVAGPRVDDEVTVTEVRARQATSTPPAKAKKAREAPAAVADRGETAEQLDAELSSPLTPRHAVQAPRRTGRASASIAAELDAANPFVRVERSDHHGDEEADDQASPDRTKPSTRRNKRPRDSRFKLTEQHESILEWTEKARYTSRKQVAVYLEVAPRIAARLLDRLVDQGFMSKKVQPGSSAAYFLTALGKQTVDSDVRRVDPDTGMGLVTHTLVVGWLMLILLKRASTLTTNIEKTLGRPVELSDFVTESELRRALNARVSYLKSEAEEASFRESGFRKQALRWEGWSDLYDRADTRAKARIKPQADQLIDLAVWELDSGRGFGMPHCPDLMLWDGKNALAFEVELSRKPASTEDIVRSYGTPDRSPYGRVIWFCGRDSVSQLVEHTVDAYATSPVLRERFIESYSRGARADDATTPQDDYEKARKAVSRFHSIQLTSVLVDFTDARLAALDVAEAAAQKANAAARARGRWHVNAAGRALACRCGVACMAAHGQFPTEQAARDFAEELI